MLLAHRDIATLIYERLCYRYTCALACTCLKLHDFCATVWPRKLTYRSWPDGDRETYKRYSESGTVRVFSFQFKCFISLHKELRNKRVTKVGAITFQRDIWIVVVTVEHEVYLFNSERYWLVDQCDDVRDALISCGINRLSVATLYGDRLEVEIVDEDYNLFKRQVTSGDIRELLAIEENMVYFVENNGTIHSTHGRSRVLIPHEKVTQGNELYYRRYDRCYKSERPTNPVCMFHKDRQLVEYSTYGVDKMKDVCTYHNTCIFLSEDGTLSFIGGGSTHDVAKEVLWMRSTYESPLLCFIVSNE